MNIQNVVNGDQCVSCGNCYSICPTKAISMEYKQDIGFFRPVTNEEECIGCGKCYRYCPAINNIDSSSLIGNYRKIFLAHSTNHFIRHEATSGGVVNSLVRYLLVNHIVDGALMVGYDPESNIEASSVLITIGNIKKLEEKTRDYASRYVIVPVLRGLRELPAYIKKLAVVGTPCQIQAVRLMGRLSENSDNLT